MSNLFKTKRYVVIAAIGIIGVLTCFVLDKILPYQSSDAVIYCNDILATNIPKGNDCIAKGSDNSYISGSKAIDTTLVVSLYIFGLLFLVSTLIFIILSILNFMRR